MKKRKKDQASDDEALRAEKARREKIETMQIDIVEGGLASTNKTEPSPSSNTVTRTDTDATNQP